MLLKNKTVVLTGSNRGIGEKFSKFSLKVGPKYLHVREILIKIF